MIFVQNTSFFFKISQIPDFSTFPSFLATLNNLLTIDILRGGATTLASRPSEQGCQRVFGNFNKVL